MSEYLTTETVTYEYDASGRVYKVITVTTEGPDDHAETPAPAKGPRLRIAPMSSVSTDPFIKAKVNQWFGEHEERDVVADLEDFRVHRSGHRRPLLPDEYPE